jgi:hypothetical protein
VTTQTAAADWVETYRLTHNAELRAAQAEPVQEVLKDILETLKSIERNIHWALEDDRDYCLETAIERAHSLVDLAHAYRQALKDSTP